MFSLTFPPKTAAQPALSPGSPHELRMGDPIKTVFCLEDRNTFSGVHSARTDTGIVANCPGRVWITVAARLTSDATRIVP